MSSGSGSSRGGGSNSLSGFLSTLIPLLPLAALYIAIFLWFRSRAKRVYQPRSALCTFRDHEKSPTTSSSLFGWVKPFWQLPDAYVLSHHSLDSYLYLRFFKVLIVICLVGCIITWPILFPVNATGPGHQTQLDVLSFSNVPNSGARYFAHAFVAWIYFAFVMFVIAKESLFYIKLRQAYLLSPAIESRMSTRTVLFTDIPENYLVESKLRTFFPMVRYVWMATNTKELEKMTKERKKTALKLEGAEIKLSKQANKQRLKHKEEPSNAPEHFLEGVKRPTHRLKPLIGKKVDTIDYCRRRIGELTPHIESHQSSHWQGKEKHIGAAFIEFETVVAAESAYKTVAGKKPKSFNARAIGQAPDQIFYQNLGMNSKLRKALQIAVTAFICVLIIFWAIPVAVVGAISNINYLTTKVPFLSFINNCPKVILGLITGLLPTVLLAVLMSLVPIIMRLLARLSGSASRAEVELKTQNYYFWFNVIQVFLITTFTSAASSVVAQIITNPSSAVTLLAENLPKASNFYINYFVLYGVAVSAKTVAQVVALAISLLLSKFLDTTPRKRFERYTKVSSLDWGSTYPVYCNLGVIALTYSCIAPLVLGFATVGFCLLYMAFRYNVFYTLNGNNINTQGRSYAMALQHLTAGVYLAEICMIGLFAINTAGSKVAAGPLVLMVIALIVTILFHISMRNALQPLITTPPLEFMMKNMEVSANRIEEGHMSDMAEPNFRDSMASTKYLHPTESSEGRKSYVQRLINPSALPPFALHMSQTIPEYPDDVRQEAYLASSITQPSPIVWIAHDELGVSEREKAASSKVIGTSDGGAWFETGTGKLICNWQKEGEEYKVTQVPVYTRPIDY